MRHEDPRGDFGRQERQREVISKIIEKGKSVSVITKYNKILKALENNIQTNLTLDDIMGIQSSYKSAAQNMESLQMAGTGVTINKIWYLQIDDQERQNLSDQMRLSLGLQTEIVKKMIDNTNTKLATQSTTQTTKNSTSASTNSPSTQRSTTNSSSNNSTQHNTGSTNTGTNVVQTQPVQKSPPVTDPPVQTPPATDPPVQTPPATDPVVKDQVGS
jgi:hypothetical protein